VRAGVRSDCFIWFVENPTQPAILEAQEAFAGLADELGLKTEDDVVNLCREVRKENWEKQYAHHD